MPFDAFTCLLGECETVMEGWMAGKAGAWF